MSNLSEDLELLRKLNEYRWRAKELREQALHALKQIECKEVRPPRDAKESPFKDKDKEVKLGGIDFERWVAGNDDVEIALLVKVQNHRDISVNEKENNRLRKASDHLKKALIDLELEQLLTQSGEAGNRSEFPVLLAARAMQALVTRAETVFNPATMYCYYRIIRELYGVAHPNWTVGAARAGIGGTTSAFVTNECIRAIFAFERALERTHKFFQETLEFYKYFSSLKRVVETRCFPKSHPLYRWIDKSIEARWLDCQIATNPRNREMALFPEPELGGGNKLLLPGEDALPNYESADEYFLHLRGHLEKTVTRLYNDLNGVRCRIDECRSKEEEKGPKEEQFIRSATGHLFALRVIENAVEEAHRLTGVFKKEESGNSELEKKEAKEKPLERILKELAKEFYRITRSVHHVLEPSKQYVKWVIDRELAAPKATFDAGELVFAATSYGAIQKWRLDDRLSRACELLVESLPGNGRLPTRRPFHADRRGYRTIPIGCEMTRSLATLMQKTAHRFDAKFVSRMLGVFEGQLIELHESGADDETLIGWNFEGAPDPDKPAVWVTAVSVLALDRIVRMLNTRINEIVLAHFDVTKPERPHTRLTLRDLMYSDYGLCLYGPIKERGEEKLTAIHLQQARAHVVRATLPTRYAEDNRNFSTIYYGPPGTGKTTLAESLALSAGVPLLRLSPGDLILQGQELIEGRAHDVFEALSMLTQCVIIFDEFEPVLKHRGEGRLSDDAGVAPALAPNSLRYRSQEELKRIGHALEHICEKDDPQFRFVLGGMLPKLIKLHDSAEKQSFAYCLGTNRLKDIDRAAKRNGRFDKRVPVYKPDALSRAGTLLYRLSQTKKIDAAAGNVDRVALFQRFIRIICATIREPADRIQKCFRIGESEKGVMGMLEYILNDRELATEWKEKANKNLETLKTDLVTDAPFDEDEKEEEQRTWIVDCEERCVVEEEKINAQTTEQEIMEFLSRCLQGQKTEEAANGIT
jgi:hypothetical protein